MKTSKILTGVMSFFFGVAVGYIVADKRLRRQYEKKTREAVESVKQAYKPKEAPGHEEQLDTKQDPLSPSDISGEDERKEEPIMAHKEPYEISPQEFASRKGYDSRQLIACSDGIITFDDGEIVNDEEMLLGDDIHELLAGAEGESVYIRNDTECCDYEIVQDERVYEDIPFSEPFDPEDL